MMGNLSPHGEEARPRRAVSNHGRNDRLAAILRDAVLRKAPQDEVGEICTVSP
jgi:hypothetical protein